MDTLASLTALLALAIQILTHPRVAALFGPAAEARSVVAVGAVLVLSLGAAFLGIRGYRRDWPRWANGRALFGAVVGVLLAAVSLLDLLLRAA